MLFTLNARYAMTSRLESGIRVSAIHCAPTPTGFAGRGTVAKTSASAAFLRDRVRPPCTAPACRAAPAHRSRRRRPSSLIRTCVPSSDPIALSVPGGSSPTCSFAGDRLLDVRRPASRARRRPSWRGPASVLRSTVGVAIRGPVCIPSSSAAGPYEVRIASGARPVSVIRGSSPSPTMSTVVGAPLGCRRRRRPGAKMPVGRRPVLVGRGRSGRGGLKRLGELRVRGRVLVGARPSVGAQASSRSSSCRRSRRRAARRRRARARCRTRQRAGHGPLLYHKVRALTPRNASSAPSAVVRVTGTDAGRELVDVALLVGVVARLARRLDALDVLLGRGGRAVLRHLRPVGIVARAAAWTRPA